MTRLPACYALSLLALLLAACTAPPAPCTFTGAVPSVTVQLLFGRHLKSGGEISDADWQDFLAHEITPRFPDGLTVFDAHGQWRDVTTGKPIAETTEVVEIVTAPDGAGWRMIDEIRTRYRARFAQDSVGVVASDSCASF
jgi:hypothetical protein